MSSPKKRLQLEMSDGNSWCYGRRNGGKIGKDPIHEYFHNHPIPPFPSISSIPYSRGLRAPLGKWLPPPVLHMEDHH